MTQRNVMPYQSKLWPPKIVIKFEGTQPFTKGETGNMPANAIILCSLNFIVAGANSQL